MKRSVIVIGAGMSGLTAARRLVDRGHEVRIFDKGRAVGGRMATRLIGDGSFDHGAQHVSVRTADFASVMEGLVDRGVAGVWLLTRSLAEPDRGVEPRYAGIGGMRRIPEFLAEGLDVTTGVSVDRLSFGEGVTAHSAEVAVASADAAVLTPPVPQTLEVLSSSGVAMSEDLVALSAIEYDPTLAVMALLGGPSGLEDGHLALNEGPIAWMADNQHKGVSAVPAVTIHSSSAFALEHLEADPAIWCDLLVRAASELLGSAVVGATPHRWRHAQPRLTRNDGALVVAGAPIVLAGEVFAGARVEGAFRSGLAAAAAVESFLT